MKLDRHRLAIARPKPLADINVTPLVDVMLVLLVVFMVTAPMLAAGFAVDLPKTRAARTIVDRQPITVTLGADGSTSIDGDIVPRDRMGAAIGALSTAEEARPIRLRADGEVVYRSIASVLDDLAAQGVTNVGLITRLAPGTVPVTGGGRHDGRPESDRGAPR